VRLEALMINPDHGFTSDVILDADRFVGRTDLIRDCMKALNTPSGLIAVYGKRGVGKSSLLRQVQKMALGDYAIVKKAAIMHEIPKHPRSYLTVYYVCDSMIKNGADLLSRLCADQDAENGLLRLVPDDGKEMVEFSRSKGVKAGADLKVVNWGVEGVESSKYAKVVPNDIVQTFRNFVNAVIVHQVKGRMKRDGLLILLDEFDVIKDKQGIGSLIKSLTGPQLKFAVCGIGQDLADLVLDHASVDRLLEEGAIHVRPMEPEESKEIIFTAERLFGGEVTFQRSVVQKIADLSKGYPYFTQLVGRECVNQANRAQVDYVDTSVFDRVLADIRCGAAFPTLEANYQRAIGSSKSRELLLHLLAGQRDDSVAFTQDVGAVVLKEVREDAKDLNLQYVDQLLPRLVDMNFGPVLRAVPERRGIYEFVNPVFRLYVTLREFV
jgi:Cdc6-like AAA superfamily ATPase